jgi:nucleotide-binding universal stress UspA family protein
MAEYKKILFPVDLEGVSDTLVDHVLTMANTFSAELHVLYVARAFDPYVGYPYSGPLLQNAEEETIKACRESLEHFCNKHLHDYPSLKMFTATGHTAREILKYVDDNQIDLVVMSTHGRRGLDRVIFGSVAQRVVQSSPVPVITMKPTGGHEENWLDTTEESGVRTFSMGRWV